MPTATTRKMSQRYFCPAGYTTKTTKPNPNPKLVQSGFQLFKSDSRFGLLKENCTPKMNYF